MFTGNRGHIYADGNADGKTGGNAAGILTHFLMIQVI
jgi:hypothetical protein